MNAGSPYRDRNDRFLISGLRRACLALIFIVISFGVSLLVSMQMLQQQVSGWAFVEALDVDRETLLFAARNYRERSEPLAYDDVVAALGLLDDRIAGLPVTVVDTPFWLETRDTLHRARQFLEASETHSREMRLRREAMLNSVKQWQDQLTQWKSDLGNTALQISLSSNRMAARVQDNLDYNRWLQDIRVSATGALDVANGQGAVTAAFWQFPAYRAFGGGEVSCLETGTICESEHAAFERALLDPQSQRSEPDNQTTHRLRASAERILRSHSTAVERVRGDTEEALFALNHLRMRNNTVRRKSVALQPVDRLMHQLTGLVTLVATSQDIDQRASSEMIDRLLLQFSFRGRGFIRTGPEVLPNVETLIEGMHELDAGWIALQASIDDFEDRFSEFELEMAQLTQAISVRAATMRDNTEFGLRLFVALALMLACLMIIMGLVGRWVARRFFVTPLSRVTGTVLDLASGRIDQPITIAQKLFGFDHMGAALEALRRAMLERRALTERNAEQKALIERNMHVLEKTTREMQWLAMHDPLTALGNRRKADEHLASLSNRSQDDVQDFCIVHLDLDRFKDINDALGHEAGDQALKHVASILAKNSKDTFSSYRIGGDEFLIIAEGALFRAEVGLLVESLRNALEHPVELCGHPARLDMSIGIAFGRDAGGDAQATLVNADLALYDVKRSGRGDYRFFTPDLTKESRRRTSLSERVLQALETDAFVPFYQPQFYADGLRLRGVETLCRWHDQTEGWISPRQFLGVAEELRLMPQIDALLVRKAGRDLTQLAAQDLTVPKISFNITAERLMQPDLPDQLLEGIPRQTHVVVELLESMSMDSMTESMRWAVGSLKEAGIGVEIDDFGSCRASIAGLISVGPDAMKIDGSIIQPLTHSQRHLQLVEAIVDIGRALNIEVVAEGVETQEHVQILTRLGCRVLQGYALARPMPFDALLPFLREMGQRRKKPTAVSGPVPVSGFGA